MDVAMTRMLLVAPQPAPKLRLIAYRKTSVDKFQAGVTVWVHPGSRTLPLYYIAGKRDLDANLVLTAIV
jgi:hypothetical protein